MSLARSVERRFSKRLLVAAVLGAAVLLIPAGLVNASGPSATVRGVITDGVSHAGVAGASVRLTTTDLPWTFTATTDATGAYALVVPNHQYAVRASAAGYYVNTTTLAVGSGMIVWNNMSLNPAAPRSAHVQGYVKDSATSAPVTTGRIAANPVSWASPPTYANASALNASGHYAIDLVPGSYVLSTDRVLNYTPYSYSYLSVAAGRSYWFNISLIAAPLVAWINGTVRDGSTSAPIPNANVSAVFSGLTVATAVSNATGAFSVRVPQGTIQLAGDAAGHAPETTTVYIYGPGTFSATLSLTPLACGERGVVQDGVTHQPIAGALVSATPIFSGGYFDEASTGASGSYFLRLPSDDYYLRASASGYAPWFSSTYLFGGVVWTNITLWPIVAGLQGYLVDGSTGAHIPGLYLYASDPRSGYAVSAVSDATGFYSLLLTPSPAVSVTVVGAAPYAGTVAYLRTTPYVTTWANITVPRADAYVHATVTDARTGLPIAGAAVGFSWGIGSVYGTTDAGGVVTLAVASGLPVYGSAWATGYFSWSQTLDPVTGTVDLGIPLNPVLNANVTVRGYVHNAVTNTSITYTYIHAAGYNGSAPWDYTDSTGYYTFNMVPAAQTIQISAYGYVPASVPVDPAPGSTIWVNISLVPDTAAPVILNFTATPSSNLGPGNPTALRAAVNESALAQATISILMLRSTSAGVGTFLPVGNLLASDVHVAPTTPGNVSVAASWDTRTSVARLSDGASSEWWPAAPSGYYYLVAINGYWDNATLTSPVNAVAYFDSRTGSLLYVYTSAYGYIAPQDQPTSTFTPWAVGTQIDLTSTAIVGGIVVTGLTYNVGTLSLSVAPAVPGGTYAALLTAMDTSYRTDQAAVVLQVVADTVPPVANAGPDQTVNQHSRVMFDGRGSTDNVGIVNYTWTFSDGSSRALYGATPSYTFNNAGVFVVTLTVRDSGGNTDTATMTVTVRDTTPPTVAITSPASGANVSGTISVAAAATDNVGVVRVVFFVDGAQVGTVSTAPYTMSLDTHSLSNGNHTIRAVAYDAAGNNATATRTIAVLNASTSGPLGIDVMVWLALILVVAAVAVGLVLLLMRRRKKEPPAPPVPPETGQAP